MSILNDQFCEELAFPCLFPAGKFGCRDVKLRPVKYFNLLLQSQIILPLLEILCRMRVCNNELILQCER